MDARDRAGLRPEYLGSPAHQRPLPGRDALNLLATARGRRWLFAILYASEGAPMGLIWWALPALLARQGVAVADITAVTSAATLPWVLKFLAGPPVDASLARGISLRAWIVACQSAMVMSLLGLVAIDWAGNLPLLTACLVVHAMFAATQDVAIDTLAIRTVPPEELGSINGWMQAGMLTGRAGVAAGTLALSEVLGPGGPVLMVALVVALPIALVLRAVAEPRSAPPGLPRPAALLALLAAPRALLAVGIALTAGAGFEFLAMVAGPLLLAGGAGTAQVSLFFGLVAPAGLVAGALAAGRLSARLDEFRRTSAGVVALAVIAGGLGGGLLAGLEPSPPVLLATMAGLYLAIGFFTAASYAMFMRQSRGAMSASRFSLFMAMTNACEAWAGFSGGRLQSSLGYGGALLILVAASLVALPLLARLRARAGD